MVIALSDVLAVSSTNLVLSAAVPAVHFGGVAIDSRAVVAGDLFVALPGEHVDGHQFAAAALDRGAGGALVRRAWLREHAGELAARAVLLDTAEPTAASTNDRPVVVAVDDPLATLQQLAQAHRRRMTAQVIGITGSVGKTSTKEAVAAVLRQRFRTLHSGKSFNNEIGVPLTLLRLERKHEAAVVEMGTYGPGEIALLCQWARPNIGIVTNVGVSHLERMGTPDVVAVAKRELVESLPADGVAILNNDDHRVRAMVNHTQARPFFYGTTSDAELWADNVERRGLRGIAFDVHRRGGETYRMETPLMGKHAVYIALPAIAAGLALGMPWNEIATGLQDAAMQSRINVVHGMNGATILDDTYNASPASCKAALDLLHDVPGQHVAVFGEMAELGPIDEEGHRAVGQAAAAVVDYLVVVGHKARWIAQAAREVNPQLPIVCASTNDDAVLALRPLLRHDTIMLVKGARVARTEEIVHALRAEGEQPS